MSIISKDLETGEECYVVCPDCGQHDCVEMVGVEDGEATYDCRRCDPDYLFTIDDAILVPVEDIDEGDYDPEDYI